jgi:hypothetical protein
VFDVGFEMPKGLMGLDFGNDNLRCVLKISLKTLRAAWLMSTLKYYRRL